MKSERMFFLAILFLITNSANAAIIPCYSSADLEGAPRIALGLKGRDLSTLSKDERIQSATDFVVIRYPQKVTAIKSEDLIQSDDPAVGRDFRSNVRYEGGFPVGDLLKAYVVIYSGELKSDEKISFTPKTQADVVFFVHENAQLEIRNIYDVLTQDWIQLKVVDLKPLLKHRHHGHSAGKKRGKS
jgi:hypothetical protein